ncbi:hypothetical protein BT69DRAFT_1282456, partial [Atractiella rhizophila]
MSSYYSYGPQYGAPAPAATPYGYTQPPQNAYSHPNPYPHYQPPADPYGTHQPQLAPQPDLSDPNQLREFYRNELAYLTVNSKPVINRLTMIAEEHARTRANVIVQCIEEALNRAPSYLRLPLLYLIDSISKNIGHPYPSLFSRFIERSFLQSYHLVSAEQPQARQKLEELLGTWRTGGTNGGELFRVGVQKGIERELWGRNGRGGGWAEGAREDSEAYANGAMGVPANASLDERTAVLADVRRLLDLRLSQTGLLRDESEIQGNEHQISALQQLENLVQSTQLTSEQVHDIRSQLAVLAPPSSLPSHQAHQPAPPAFQPPPSHGQSQYDQLAPNGLPLIDQNLMNSLAGIDLSTLLQAVSQPPPQQAVPPPAPVAQTSQPAGGMGSWAGIDLSSLGSLLPGASTTAPLSAAVSSTAGTGSGEDLLSRLLGGQEKVADLSKLLQDLNAQAEEEKENKAYEADVLALNMTLSHSDIQKGREGAWRLLYDRFGVQCKQCGRRYLEGKKGRRDLDDHLDFHYRLNKQVREGISRAQNRSVLLDEAAWMVGDAGPSGSGSGVRAESPGAIERREREAEEGRRRKMYVVAPTDPKREGRPCSVCMEGFKKEFREESGEWVWFNAVFTEEGRIDHATCDWEVRERERRKAVDDYLARSAKEEDFVDDIKEDIKEDIKSEEDIEEDELYIKKEAKEEMKEEEKPRKRKASEESGLSEESDKKRVKVEE